MKVIPIQDAPAFTQTLTLDGKVYRISLRFNWRGQFWSMGISTPAGQTLLAGVKLVVNYDLTSIYLNPALPPGLFAVIDTSGEAGSPVDRDTLGAECVLVYMTEAERAAL